MIVVVVVVVLLLRHHLCLMIVELPTTNVVKINIKNINILEKEK